MNDPTWEVPFVKTHDIDAFISAVVERYYTPGIRWRTYPNPMRTDGVFVAEEGPIEVYEGVTRLDGSPVYHNLPKTTHALRRQLPHAIADRVIRRLNEEKTAIQ